MRKVVPALAGALSRGQGRPNRIATWSIDRERGRQGPKWENPLLQQKGRCRKDCRPTGRAKRTATVVPAGKATSNIRHFTTAKSAPEAAAAAEVAEGRAERTTRAPHVCPAERFVRPRPCAAESANRQSRGRHPSFSLGRKYTTAEISETFN
uniref:Uncharacterized protein n=1 Tax=Trichuris muris TaxID=70415 RepID=A0A5S6QV38_TRIMR